MLSRGRIQALLTSQIAHFLKRHTRRGPQETRVILHDDSVLVRCRGLLDAEEASALARSAGQGPAPDGFRDARLRQVRENRHELDRYVEQLTGKRVLDVIMDLSLDRDEWVFLVLLEQPA